MKINKFWTGLSLLAAGLTVSAGFATTVAAAGKKCLYVSSYHKGYSHSDQIEQGLRAALTGHCEIRQFDMDTKRKKSEAHKKNSALAAKRIIESWNPDIVITSDDNAAKYLIRPYYKDHSLPFVFSGLNWTAKEYGFPYSNATGIIEVAPLVPMLKRSKQIVPALKRAFYLGADVLSEKKNLRRYQRAATKMGIALDHVLVSSTKDWVAAYTRAQEYDLVIMGSRNGISGWNHEMAHAGVMRHSRRLSITIHDWMMPYTILGMTKVSREQGEWAGKTALKVLGGLSPSRIPIVPNRQRDIWINKDILKLSGIFLPRDLLRKGKRLAKIAN